MEESILESIKGLLGPDSAYDVFDPDIVLFINSVIATLTQLGIGPQKGYRITGPGETWKDFIGDEKDLDSVKSYIFMKVKMVFDPPTSSFVLSAMEKMCEEYEWRLKTAVEDKTLLTIED